MFANASSAFGYLILWGLIAIIAMTTILQASQGLGLSRMSLPFLVGTFFTGQRRRAYVVGFSVYVIGGWLFAFLYFFCLRAFTFTLGGSARWSGSFTVCFSWFASCLFCRSCIPEWPPNITEQQKYDSWNPPVFSE
jgi:hypothetical protein